MLNLSGRTSTAPPRAPFAVSVALHLAAALALAYASQMNARAPLPLFRPARTSLVYVPVVAIEIPPIKLAELRAPKPVITEEPAPLRSIPEVAPVFESRRVEVLKPVELPIEPPPPAPTPVAPRAPEVTVGAFANPTAPARLPEPTRQVEAAGFDRSASVRADAPQQTAISDAGFNRANVVASAAAAEGRVVRDTGFGNTNSREKPRTIEPPLEVQQVAFNNTRAPQSASRVVAAPPAPRITPVEVLSKPTPLYTEEARKLGIEGDVLLEVEFTCDGTVRVIRVVRGLGHGLDEAAVNAAQQIRFKPAQASGQAVDSRATVNIVFRLA